MARRKPKTNRQARKIRQAGASLLVLGVTCLVLPAAMRDSAFGAAFAGLPALALANRGGRCPLRWWPGLRWSVVDTARRLPPASSADGLSANSNQR